MVGLLYSKYAEYVKYAKCANQTYQTKPTKPNLPNQTKLSQPSLRNQTNESNPKLLVKVVNNQEPILVHHTGRQNFLQHLILCHTCFDFLVGASDVQACSLDDQSLADPLAQCPSSFSLSAQTVKDIIDHLTNLDNSLEVLVSCSKLWDLVRFSASQHICLSWFAPAAFVGAAIKVLKT